MIPWVSLSCGPPVGSVESPPMEGLRQAQVVFTCACLFALSSADPARGQDSVPRFYMYDDPRFAGWSDQLVQPIVRVHVDGLEPSVAAQRVGARINELVSSGVLDTAHITIMLQN